MSLRTNVNIHSYLHFGSCAFFDADCNKRGQTTVVGLRYRQVVTLNQKGGGCNYFLAYLRYWCDYVLSELPDNSVVWKYLNTMSSHRYLLSSPSSKSSSRTCPPRKTKPNSSSNQYSAIQNRKAVSSALWLQLTLVVCYLPQGITGALWTNRGEFLPSLYLARQFASTLVFLNSSLNPILYCWKFREVRQAVKDTISHFCCSSSKDGPCTRNKYKLAEFIFNKTTKV